MRNLLITIALLSSLTAFSQATIDVTSMTELEYCEGCLDEASGSETIGITRLNGTVSIDADFQTVSIKSNTEVDGVYKLSDMRIWTDPDAVVIQGIASNSEGKYVFLLNGDYEVFSMREYNRGQLGNKSYKFY